MARPRKHPVIDLGLIERRITELEHHIENHEVYKQTLAKLVAIRDTMHDGLADLMSTSFKTGKRGRPVGSGKKKRVTKKTAVKKGRKYKLASARGTEGA